MIIYIKKSCLATRLLAEDTGFEPADAVNVNGFQDRRFKPLSQSSTLNYYTQPARRNQAFFKNFQIFATKKSSQTALFILKLNFWRFSFFGISNFKKHFLFKLVMLCNDVCWKNFALCVVGFYNRVVAPS